MHGVFDDGCVHDNGIPIQGTRGGDEIKVFGHMAPDAPPDQIDGRVGAGC